MIQNKKETHQRLSKAFKAVRLKENLTQTEMGKFFSIQQTSVALLESGQLKMSLYFWLSFLEKFNLPPDLLFDGNIKNYKIERQPNLNMRFSNKETYLNLRIIFKSLRMREGIHQGEMGKILNKSREQINMMESGKIKLGLYFWMDFANKFGLPPNIFFHRFIDHLGVVRLENINKDSMGLFLLPYIYSKSRCISTRFLWPLFSIIEESYLSNTENFFKDFDIPIEFFYDFRNSVNPKLFNDILNLVVKKNLFKEKLIRKKLKELDNCHIRKVAKKCSTPHKLNRHFYRHLLTEEGTIDSNIFNSYEDNLKPYFQEYIQMFLNHFQINLFQNQRGKFSQSQPIR